ncbi:MAG: WGR domain-containing protein [Rhodobacteraceae bacterium]|nr:WGR domain-containing protein [Paracoccaceae bacterium]
MSEAIHLVRCDPSRNMARFYRLELCQTLFGEVVLIRRWGRIGTIGRSREVVISETDLTDGYRAILDAAVQTKIRRGYLEDTASN